jgi:glycine/D-amino acid oxidase-like deaminating enzyme
VVTGHGAWGVTLGPGSAQLVVNAMLDGGEIPPELQAARFGAP